MKAFLAVLLLGVGLAAAASKCETERDAAKQSGLLGAHAPECEADGRYHHTQCHEAMCGCVNQNTGKMVPDTVGPIAQKSSIEARCSSKCEQERATAVTSGLIGAHTPQCVDGKYHHTQCHGSVCSCVNQDTGKIVPETSGSIADKVVIEFKCGKPCEKERAKALTSGLLGAHAPECEADGSYHHTQCHEAVCGCVSQENGKMVPDTMGPIAQKSNIEARCATTCERQRAEILSKAVFGGHALQCEDGKFKATQCMESECWCADPDTGMTVPGAKVVNIADVDQLMCDKAPAAKNCDDAQKAALEHLHPGMMIPRCTLDGNYYPMQCTESVCYCVNRETGAKVAGTEEHVSQIASLDKKCSAMAGQRVAGPCEVEAMEAKKTGGLLGKFIPKCEESNGRYYPMQCHGSTCFCVDRLTGQKLAGTEGHVTKHEEIEGKCRSSNGIVAFAAVSQPQGCQAQREAASGLLGAFKPECEDNGRYQAAQCHERTCFCVDAVTGEKKEGSEKTGVDQKSMMKSCMMRMSPCEKERQKAGTGRGAFMPQCKADGSYQKKQCHGSVCFCVDGLDGSKVEGTEHRIGLLKTCEITACQKQNRPTTLLGAFKPRCDKDHGNFQAVQCRESQCFCVNRITGQQEGESVHVTQKAALHEQCMTECEKARDISTTPRSLAGGPEAPRCRADGSFYQVQCREAVCQCVDRINGEPLLGTKKNISFYRQLERQCPGTGKQCSNSRMSFDSCAEECTPVSIYGSLRLFCCCA